MPSHVSVKDGVIHVSFAGVITEADLDQLATDVLEIETAASVIPDRITDLTMVTAMEIDFSSILSLARRRMESTIGNQIKSAIVACRPEHVGFARMFQTVNRHPHITIRIFEDMESAVEWLAAP